MAVTRLKRKAKRNKQTAAIRRDSIKQLTAKPVIKNVDIEELKASFKAAPKKEAKAKKEETPKAEAAPVKEVKEEKKVAAKKPAAKKAAVKKPAAKKAEAKEIKKEKK